MAPRWCIFGASPVVRIIVVVVVISGECFRNWQNYRIANPFLKNVSGFGVVVVRGPD